MASAVAVTVTPVYGANGGAPLCTLLTVDGTRILLDCGWSDSFDPAALEPLKALAPTLDVVLLSHSDLEHAGALPVLLSRWRCPALVFSTLPVNRLAQMYLYDAFLARSGADPAFAAFNLDDVDAAFKLIHFPGGRYDLLRYSEERTLKGVTLTPLPAGRSLGGALWRITKGPESILYAVGFNHRTERHLGKAHGLSLAALSRRPTVMITDATHALTVHAQPSAQTLQTLSAAAGGGGGGPGAGGAGGGPPGKVSARDAVDRELVDAILGNLRAGGNVLLPTDTAGRCLELLLRIDGSWPSQESFVPPGAHIQGLPQLMWGPDGNLSLSGPECDFPIVFLNHHFVQVGPNTLEFARTMLEYMNDKLTRSFANLRVVPFQLERVTVATNLAQMDAVVTAATAPIKQSLAAAEAIHLQRHTQKARASRMAVAPPPPPMPPLHAITAAGTRPALVLASFPSLETGFGRELFLKWAADPKTLVLFTDKGGLPVGSTGAQLLSGWPGPAPRSVTIPQWTRVPLMGAELRRWEEQRAEEAKTAARAAEEAKAKAEAERRPGGAGSAGGAGASSSSAAAGGGGGGDVAMADGAALGRGGAYADDDEDADMGGTGEDEPVTYTDDEDDELALARSVAGRTGPLASAGAAPGHGGSATARFPLFGLRDNDADAAAAAVAAAGEAPGGKDDAAGAGAGGKDEKGGGGGRVGEWSLYGAAINAADFKERRPPPPPIAALAPVPTVGPDGKPLSASEIIRGRLQQLLPGRMEAAAAAAAAIGGSGAAAGGGKGRDAAATGAGDDEEAPTKLIRASLPVKVACGVSYFPLEGVADGPALRNIIADISPLRLVVVHGAPAAAASLADAARPYCAHGVEVPRTGEVVDASSGAAELVAVLDDAVYRRLAFRRVGPYDVAFIDSAVAPGASPALIPVAGGASGASAGSDGHAPSLVRPTPLLLPDVMKRLQRAGIECDLVEGGLVTRPAGIIVQRSRHPGGVGLGGLELEGPACPDYYRVRQVLYEAYTMV